MSDKLKEDFPIEWEDDHFVTRREFFKFLTLASGGVTFGTAALALASRFQRDEIAFDAAKICSASDLRPGASLAFSYPRPSDLCLLVRRKDGGFVAYSRRCTHLSCPVEYEVRDEREFLYCPCHHGEFSLSDGAVLQGPPPRPLPQIKIELRGLDVWAVGATKGEEI